jgi:RHH-type transcriptional regulator, proline utilization regulon repressor / proline dehydrogenase / delta 1-pyrroline-5-carboxylate dehydrogenase
MNTPSVPLRAAIGAAYREDEAVAVRRLAEFARMPATVTESAAALALDLVQALRDKRSHASGVDVLMREFSLSSQEGVALMCLAEALLRIPDRATADRLIRDKVGGGDWEQHLGRSGSLFVNAATWGLLITGKLVATSSAENLSSALTRLLARGGEPVIRGAMDLAMRLLGRQFVLGETIAQALSRSVDSEQRGYRHSYDMLGEAAMTMDDAERYFRSYEAAIHAIGGASARRGVYAGPGISVKLSALHPRYARAQRERVLGELMPRLKQLMLLARQHDIGLTVDAEETERLELSLDVIESLALDADLAGWQGFGLAVQAYQKRAPTVLDWLAELARRSRRRLMVRLVKGAYWDTEIKRAQIDGQSGYPVFTRKTYTDVCYLACAKKLLADPVAFFPQFATHNAATLATLHVYAGSIGAGDYEFQCLHGMGETLYDEIVAGSAGFGPGRACRIYAPVGTHETLLAYLVRRLLENGANSSFVHRIVDPGVDPAELIADPIEQAAAFNYAPHPAIPLPGALFKDSGRRNSGGVDLADDATLAALEQIFASLRSTSWRAGPMLAADAGPGNAAASVRNPARRSDVVGEAVFATREQVAAACAAAERDRSWASRPAEARAAVLERAADLIEAERDKLVYLCICEAGKTAANAFGEVREAVDFCRYYAAGARRLPQDATPLGPVACISPWNFPLAIFLGQVTAALAAGNAVLAKPAEQTPLVAALAVSLLHEAGVPRAALQLLPGAGDVGAALVGDARVRGVVFTGSNEAALAINRALASRDAEGGEVPLIAETGGQNAMLVDSSALPEQVVADVIASAFDSAGQRCSALRVLCLQEEIAERVITMLKGAMRELKVGDPAELKTDVGPVIDEEARARLMNHIGIVRRTASWHFELPLPPGAEQGSFVAPIACEIGGIGELTHEVFGPVLHVLRFAREEMDELLQGINATGYALTMGVHSRIDETIGEVAARSRAGNLYVNRNIIGAVVGVQPFGGESLSGTGPKAGGPLYLPRLARGVAVTPRELGGVAAPRRVAGLDALAVLERWIEQGAALDPMLRSPLLLHCAAMREASLAGVEIELAGPTGERNTLSFTGRGKVGIVGSSLAARVRMLAAILATMNEAVQPETQVAREVYAALPPALREIVRFCANGSLREERDLCAVLFDGSDQDADQLRRELASRKGAIVPLIRVHDGHYPLERLVAEKAVSVNTAAAGGNATLMRLT